MIAHLGAELFDGLHGDETGSAGESSRSLQERAVEHARYYRKSNEECDMLKDWARAHRGEPICPINRVWRDKWLRPSGSS